MRSLWTALLVPLLITALIAWVQWSGGGGDHLATAAEGTSNPAAFHVHSIAQQRDADDTTAAAAAEAPPAASTTPSTLTALGGPSMEPCCCGIADATAAILQRNASVRRFLTTAKIHKKYGLTNIMLIAASMFAYASLDQRGVVFPLKSPVALETDLLDLRRTEICLASANVLLESKAHVDRLQLKQVSAWRLGLHLGDRKLAGSLLAANASALLGKLKMNMGLTKHIPIVSYGDFFLRFPFFAIRPLDVCYYLARIQFQMSIEQRAHEAVAVMTRHMEGEKKGRESASWMALHIRLESDVYKLNRQFRRVPPSALETFLKRDIVPIWVASRVLSVYVCAGPLDDDYWTVLLAVASAHNVRVFYRGRRVDDLSVTQISSKIPIQTTNHVDAAVDLLVAAQAHEAVSTHRSTFLLAILSRRCGSSNEMRHNSKKVAVALKMLTAASLLYTTVGEGLTKVTTQVDKASAEHEQPNVKRRSGVWAYDFALNRENMHLTSLEFVGCDSPWQGHCFYADS